MQDSSTKTSKLYSVAIRMVAIKKGPVSGCVLVGGKRVNGEGKEE
jgi:hypothetical protein